MTSKESPSGRSSSEARWHTPTRRPYVSYEWEAPRDRVFGLVAGGAYADMVDSSFQFVHGLKRVDDDHIGPSLGIGVGPVEQDHGAFRLTANPRFARCRRAVALVKSRRSRPVTASNTCLTG